MSTIIRKNRFFYVIMVLLAILASTSFCEAANKTVQQKKTANAIDTRADSLLKAMSTYLSNLQQYSVTSTRVVEVTLKSGQKIQFSNHGRNYIKRPNMLRVDFKGDPMNPLWIVPGDKRKPLDVSLYYDGKTLTFFEKNIHEYASATAPSTLDSTIDYAMNCLDVEAPAADLIYENSYAVLMDSVTSGMYLGKADIDSIECYHLAFSKPDVDWQIWIENTNTPLPLKYVITSKKEPGTPDFEITFHQWDVSSVIPESTFKFTPPKDAKKTDFQQNKCKEISK